MTDANTLLVTPDWLAEHRQNPCVKIIDGSWHMPAANRNAATDYQTAHIPGAAFFDIDHIADHETDLPHMLPTPQNFAKSVGAMGICETDTIIIYDTVGIFSAPRVWWMFRIMGAQDVRIVNGGLPAWRSVDHDCSSQVPTPEACVFIPNFHADAVKSLIDMQHLTQTGDGIILDARPADRFSGHAPEPRSGLPSGHMPNSTSLPASSLTKGGRFKTIDQLEEVFRTHSITPTTKITTSCGSGVTAAILNFGLALTGHKHTSLYDGSWAEWAARNDTEIISAP